MKVLVIQQRMGIGDMVIFLPYIHAISKKYRVDLNQITIGNGSNDLIEFVSRCFLGEGKKAIYSQHGFAIYPLAIKATGAVPVKSKAKNWFV